MKPEILNALLDSGAPRHNPTSLSWVHRLFINNPPGHTWNEANRNNPKDHVQFKAWENNPIMPDES